MVSIPDSNPICYNIFTIYCCCGQKYDTDWLTKKGTFYRENSHKVNIWCPPPSRSLVGSKLSNRRSWAVCWSVRKREESGLEEEEIEMQRYLDFFFRKWSFLQKRYPSFGVSVCVAPTKRGCGGQEIPLVWGEKSAKRWTSYMENASALWRSVETGESVKVSSHPRISSNMWITFQTYNRTPLCFKCK